MAKGLAVLRHTAWRGLRAIVYTLVETAKANELEPYSYLETVLTELPYLGKTPNREYLAQFLPWSPAMRSACAQPKTEAKVPRDL